MNHRYPEAYDCTLELVGTCFKRAIRDYAENESLKKEIETMKVKIETLERDREVALIKIEQLLKENASLTKEKASLEKDKARLKVQLARRVNKTKDGNTTHSIIDVMCEERYTTPSRDHGHTPSPVNHSHTPSPGNHGHIPSPGNGHTYSHSPSPPQPNKYSTTMSLFPSPSSLNSENEVSDESAHISRGLLGGVAAPKGRRPLQRISSSPQKSRVRYLEVRPEQGHKCTVTCESCDHTSKPSSLVARAPDRTCDVTCLDVDHANSITRLMSTKVAQSCDQACDQVCDVTHMLCDQSCDQACDVTHMPCDMQDGSRSLHVMDEREGLHPEERGVSPEDMASHDHETSFSDKMSPSLLTSKPARPHPPSQNLDNKASFKMASTFIMPPIGVASASVGLGTLALSPIQPLPLVEGIPMTDSQCSLDTSETQPPSPKIDTSRCGLNRVRTPDGKKRGRRRRGRGLKQTTLTQVLPDGSLSLATPTTMVGVTSGMRQVEAIFSDPNNGLLRIGEEEGSDHKEVPPPKRQWTSPDVIMGEWSQGEELEEEKEGEEENTLVESEDEKDLQDEYAKKLARTAGLPTYKFVVPIRKKADRDKLDAKACPDCQKWFSDGDGIHRDKREHLKQVCRHKHLYLPPDTDPRVWDISFPNTEECERIMGNRN